jgi:hypothetical protein
VRELATGRILRVLPQPDHSPENMGSSIDSRAIFAPDGRTLVIVTHRKGQDAVHIWELATGKERVNIALPETPDQAPFMTLAFSPDGRTLATGGLDSIQLWDVATGREVLRRSVQNPPACLVFSPDGKVLVSGHWDGTALLWDLAEASERYRSAATQTDAQELEACWAALKSEDAHKASAAAGKFVAGPVEAVRTMRKHLVAVQAVPPQKIRQLVADLDGNEFARRKAASEGLIDLEELAFPALQEALRANPSIEKHQRIEALLSDPYTIRSPATLQGVRAVEALEQIGSAEAKELLATLAGGAPEARLTQEAKASLERLSRREAAVR